MTLTWLFFSFDGRINRAIWWGVRIGTAALALGLITLVGPNADPSVYLAIGLGTLAMAIAPSVKRLHDRDKSGWWVLLFFLVPLLLEHFGGSFMRPDPPAIPAFASASIIIQLWALVELGILPGTPGPNRYGPDPLGHRPPPGPPSVT